MLITGAGLNFRPSENAHILSYLQQTLHDV